MVPKLTAMQSVRLQSGGFWLEVELHRGGSATNGATLVYSIAY